jgi:hypothetical protein
LLPPAGEGEERLLGGPTSQTGQTSQTSQTVEVFLATPTAWQRMASAPLKASKQKGASPFMGLIWTH